LRPYGCTVTTLCPGVTITGFQERAGFTSDLAIMRLGGASAASVAQSGYTGLMAGRRTVIPGLANKLLCFFAPRLPTALMLPMVASMQKAKTGKLQS
jgi:hypothetical protein